MVERAKHARTEFRKSLCLCCCYCSLWLLIVLLSVLVLLVSVLLALVAAATDWVLYKHRGAAGSGKRACREVQQERKASSLRTAGAACSDMASKGSLEEEVIGYGIG